MVSRDADIAKLLALVNQQRDLSKTVRNIKVKIDRTGKAKEVVFTDNGVNAGSKATLARRIKNSSFIPSAGAMKGKTIKLVFRELF